MSQIHPLIQLIQQNKVNEVEQYLIEHPDKVNELVGQRFYPLHLAIKRNSKVMVSLLDRLGAKWDIPDQDEELQKLPLFYCIPKKKKIFTKKQRKLFKWILTKKRHVLFHRDANGFTILHEIIQKDQPEIVEETIKCLNVKKWNQLKQFMNAGNISNVTALMLCAIHQHSKCAKELLKYKEIDLNAQLTDTYQFDSYTLSKGWTAFHISCAIGAEDMIKVFLEAGAQNEAIGDIPKPSDVLCSQIRNMTLKRRISLAYFPENIPIKTKKVQKIKENIQGTYMSEYPHMSGKNRQSVLQGPLFYFIRIQYRILRKIQKPKYARELMDALIMILYSLLTDNFDHVLKHIWLINSTVSSVKRESTTLVILCPLASYFNQDDPLYNATQIALICPLSACCILCRLLKEPEIKELEKSLFGHLKHKRLHEEYVMGFDE